MPLRRAALALTVVALVGAGAPAARADGDPASDVLLGENVFYPYSPAVSASVERELNRATTAAARAHFPLKVALIASPVDLGVIPDLFGHPQKYADFLDQEISFQARQPLLVVMRTGFGTQGVPPAAAAAARELPKPPSGSTDDLGRAALSALTRMAAAAGHPIAATSAPSSGGSGSAPALVAAIALAVAAAATAAAVVVTRRRARR